MPYIEYLGRFQDLKQKIAKADGGHYVGWTLHKKADGKDLKDRAITAG